MRLVRHARHFNEARRLVRAMRELGGTHIEIVAAGTWQTSTGGWLHYWGRCQINEYHLQYARIYCTIDVKGKWVKARPRGDEAGMYIECQL